MKTVIVPLAVLFFLPLVLDPSPACAIESKDTHFYFGSLQGHVHLNEDRRRADWQQPDKVADHLLIRPGEVIADIGAGTGYFTLVFAKRTGPGGMVFAVDVEQRMLDMIRSRAARDGVHNIKTVLAQPGDPLLPPSSIDLLFICNTYFNFENKTEYLGLLKQVLKKEGRIAIIEHRVDSRHDKPPLHKRTPRERVLDDFLKSGFTLSAEFHFLPHQYFLVFTRGGR